MSLSEVHYSETFTAISTQEFFLLIKKQIRIANNSIPFEREKTVILNNYNLLTLMITEENVCYFGNILNKTILELEEILNRESTSTTKKPYLYQ